MTDVSRYVRQGEAKLLARDWQAAYEAFEVVVRTTPQDAAARRGLGQALLGLGLYDRAIRELQAVVATAPEDLAARRSLGEAFARLGSYPQAVSQFRRASEIDPGR